MTKDVEKFFKENLDMFLTSKKYEIDYGQMMAKVGLL
jgi:hypothetical protein